MSNNTIHFRINPKTKTAIEKATNGKTSDYIRRLIDQDQAIQTEMRKLKLTSCKPECLITGKYNLRVTKK